MSNLESNLRIAAGENFRLYSDDYPTNPDGSPTPECETALKELAEGYGRHDGFYDLGMSPEQVERVVFSEFQNFLNTENE